ncbi:GIY-YIG nuclease family protein [Deinococcus wulumuqiensis]|uniref:GIY-YIG nuclease family protein n=1 Tax=Deinococcus wulumuqiensis TaxID=980427 RepID=UPI003C6C820F
MTRGIYSITHSSTGRVYVGQSRHVEARIQGHFSALKRGEHANKELQRLHDKDGQAGFHAELVEIVED